MAAQKFYEKHGFRVEERLENYYPELDPPHCFILVKDIEFD